MYHALSDDVVASGLEAMNAEAEQEFREYTRNGDSGFYWNSDLEDSKSGRKNEFLWMQQQVCYSGINRVVTAEVDGRPINNEKFYAPGGGQYIEVSTGGGIANPRISAQFAERESAVFNGSAYATALFKLNRDEYQYSGRPNIRFFVEGMKVNYFLDENNLSPDKEYSNSPALCLLDYLTSEEYGKGLSLDKIDLPSFFAAHELCSEIQNVSSLVQGYFHLGETTRDIPLYECNLVLSSEDTILDNVRKILSTMNGAFLTWSGGKFSLRVVRPKTAQEQQELVSLSLSDEDLIDGTLSITYPGLESRLNRAVVRFKNEHSNLREDTATWPSATSADYDTFREEDNQLDLKADFFEEGITDYYHALQEAANKVRFSRNNVVYKFEALNQAVLLEVGDIITLSLDNFQLPEELVYLQVQELNPTNELSVEITASTFDYRNSSWVAVGNAPLIPDADDRNIGTVDRILDPQIRRKSNGKYELSWRTVNDARVNEYGNRYYEEDDASSVTTLSVAEGSSGLLAGTVQDAVVVSVDPEYPDFLSIVFNDPGSDYRYLFETFMKTSSGSITGLTTQTLLSQPLSAQEIESWDVLNKVFSTESEADFTVIRSSHGDGGPLTVQVDCDLQLGTEDPATVSIELFINDVSVGVSTQAFSGILGLDFQPITSTFVLPSADEGFITAKLKVEGFTGTCQVKAKRILTSIP